ncbi:MAG: DNA cytosine methyltransferase [Acidobacteriaceae bacterium]
MASRTTKAKAKDGPSQENSRTYLSFFSGALGLDIGLEQAGLECLSVNEINPVACSTIQANIADVFHRPKRPKLYSCDIRALGGTNLCDDLGIVPGELFAMVGGPPCQAFSTAGRRLGLNDERGNVFLHFLHLIGALRPKYAIFENVRGLLSCPLVHRPHSERGPDYPPLSSEELPKGALQHILAILEGYGYRTTFNLYNTANFGVPQIRERLVFFASREGLEVPFLAPTHDRHGKNGLPSWLTLRHAISSLDGKLCEAGKFPERRLKYYKMLTEGQNWRDLPVRLQKEAMGQSWYSGGGKTGFYRRLSWERPAPTLVTSPTMPATDLCHPEELRPLSVQEYMAIQTFPSSFKLAGKLTDRYRQVGNAVPCHFGAVIGEHLLAFDEHRFDPEFGDTYRPSRYTGTDHHSWLQPQLALGV